jgi:small redox-active disulfide protein 2
MKIKVYGSGCSTCKSLFERVKKVIIENEITAEVEHITDVQAMIDMGFIQSPALVIDGVPVLAGHIPSEEQILEIIKLNKETDINREEKQ